MKTVRIALAAALIGLVIGAPSAKQQLSNDEVKALFDPSATFWSQVPRRSMGVKTTWSADGTLVGTTDTGQMDFGNWEVKNNKLCRTWRRWANGDTQCWTIAHLGDNKYQVTYPDGYVSDFELLARAAHVTGRNESNDAVDSPARREDR